jgi:hypothetical protein
VSEFLAQTLGKSINYLIDKTDSIETVLDGASVSLVTSVTQTNLGTVSSTYTVPAGKTFVGSAYYKITAGTVTVTTGDYNESLPFAASGNNKICLPFVLTAGSTLVSSSSNAFDVYIRGVLIETAALTIP